MQEFYIDLIQRLKKGGVNNPALEARILLKNVTELSEASLITGDIPLLDTLQKDLLDDYVARRLAGEPVSRILGVREFWGLEFALSPDTLDPRPDTEILVETALKRFAGRPPERILDIGTGTGCILISLLHEWPETTGVATDLSAGALDTARRNAEKHGVADRATFVRTSWAAGVEGPFDLILSNPPYIRSDVIPNLDINVKNHDPILALDGGADGLEAYRAILTETKRLISPGGIALFEIGFDQGEAVSRLVEDAGATPGPVIPDWGGNPRVVEGAWG
ncbi:MAG: peptide chain release factor N(5)-glutamine methyltransferase [Micavibrio sp.]